MVKILWTTCSTVLRSQLQCKPGSAGVFATSTVLRNCHHKRRRRGKKNPKKRRSRTHGVAAIIGSACLVEGRLSPQLPARFHEVSCLFKTPGQGWCGWWRPDVDHRDAREKKKKREKKEAFLTQKQSQTDLRWLKYTVRGSAGLLWDLFLMSMPHILFSSFFFLKLAFMTVPRRLVTVGHCSSIFYGLLGRCTVLEELDVNIFLFSAATAKSLPTTNYNRGQFESCLGFFFFFQNLIFHKTSFTLGVTWSLSSPRRCYWGSRQTPRSPCCPHSPVQSLALVGVARDGCARSQSKAESWHRTFIPSWPPINSTFTGISGAPIKVAACCFTNDPSQVACYDQIRNVKNLFALTPAATELTELCFFFPPR